MASAVDERLRYLRSWLPMLARCLVFTCLTVSLALAGGTPAFAVPTPKERVEAQKLLQEGLKLEKNGDWTAARDAFEQSLALNDTPSARRRLALAEAQLGHLIEAIEHLKQVLDDRRSTWWDKKQTKTNLQDLEARIPRLIVNVPKEFKGTVRIDELELTAATLGQPVQVNPGSRTVHAEAEGFVPFEKVVVLSDRQEETVLVQLDPVPEEKPVVDQPPATGGSTRTTIGYVSLAAGGVGLIVGTAFGLAARSTREELRQSCANNVCSETQRETYDTGTLQANVSTVGFILGGVGVGLGTVLLLTGSNSDTEPAADSAHVTPYVGPGSAGFTGRF